MSLQTGSYDAQYSKFPERYEEQTTQSPTPSHLGPGYSIAQELETWEASRVLWCFFLARLEPGMWWKGAAKETHPGRNVYKGGAYVAKQNNNNNKRNVEF